MAAFFALILLPVIAAVGFMVGANAGANTTGLGVCADNVAIQGLSVTNFAQAGIGFGLFAHLFVQRSIDKMDWLEALNARE